MMQPLFSNCTLDDLADFRNGKFISPSRYSPSGKYPVFGSNGLINRTDDLLNAAPVVVIGRVGAFCGSIHAANEPSWVTDNAIVVEPKPDVDYRFLYYRLKSLDLNRTAIGSAQPLVTQSGLKIVKTVAPPLPEQRAIAGVLGALDDKIELNRRMNETLEALAQCVFKSWFVDATEKGAAKGWREGVLDDLLESVLGGDWGADQPTQDESEPTLCIRGADIPDLQRSGTGNMPTRFLKPSSLQKRRLRDGDLAVEISGGSPTQSTGRPVLVSQSLLDRLQHPLVCSNFCRILKLKSPAASKFVYLWLRWLYATDEFLQFENGTTGIKNLAFTIFSSQFLLVIPPNTLLEEFDKIVTPLFARQQANGEESRTLAALRDALLPKLLSGAIRIKNAE